MGSLPAPDQAFLPDSLDTQILCIGGGPTGLTSAILLARYGYRVTIVERHAERLGQPKAHAINPRSLEIYKQAGLDTQRLRSLGMSPADGDMVHFADSMRGVEFGTLPYERQTDEAKAITPEPLFNIPQPLLEEFLYEAASQIDLITIWKNVQFEECVDNKGDIQTSLLLEKSTGRTTRIKSRYMLACDGAGSRSRAKLHIPFSKLPGHPDKTLHHVSIHFKADLTSFKSGTLWFFIGPHQNGILICYNRKSNWVFVTDTDPEITPTSKFTDQYCRCLIDNAIGEHVSYEILSKTHWATNPKVADCYRSPTNPAAFLVGDAAHAFPPTGGLGVNTGIADAHNLAWKIHAVEQQWAEQDFLDTYTGDRRPIAVANAWQSALNQKKLYQLMRLTSDPSLRAVESVMENPESAARILRAIDANADHFDSIDLQIGYQYGADPPIEGRCDRYTARAASGVRLPHAWIKRHGVRCSTLDLISGFNFVILAHKDFGNAGCQQVDLGHVSVPVEVLYIGKHFVDEDGAWSELMQLESNMDAGILVRPDQHILKRIASWDEAAVALKEFFKQ